MHSKTMQPGPYDQSFQRRIVKHVGQFSIIAEIPLYLAD